MRPHYAGLVALFVDSASALHIRDVARDTLSAAGSLLKRADTTVTPAAISVAASQYWDGNDGPWSSFPMRAGTPEQDVRVFVSTTNYNTWTVQASGCPTGGTANCEAKRGEFFLTNESLTWVPNSIFDLAVGNEMNLDLDDTANYGFDTVGLGWQGSGGPTVKHSTVASLATYNFWLGSFGLNPQPANFSTYTDPQPSFMTQLYNNNSIPSISYGYTAGNQYRFSNVYGSLTLGGYDSSKFEPTNLTIPFGSDVSRDLLVGIQSITSDGTSLASSSDDIYAMIDSTVPYLYLPESVCESFETAFNLSWNPTYELYLVNDTLHTQLTTTNPNITFTLGASTTASTSSNESVTITLPYAAFDLTASYPLVENSTRYFPLKRATNDTQYTLGRVFLQEAYLIADYERRNFTIAPCRWVENAASDIVSILSPNATATTDASDTGGSNNDALSSGAIAGVVIGIVAAVAIIGLVLFLWRRRRAAEKRRLAELEAREKGGEYGGGAGAGLDGTASGGSSDDAEASKPFISGPIGGELGNDSEIHEMQGGAHGGGAWKGFGGVGGTGTGMGTGAASEMESPFRGEMDGADTASNREYFGKVPGGTHEVEGNNEPIYEMQGSDVQELPNSEARRQSWTRGDELLKR